MSLREAAAATGRPPEAIRAMVRRGRLKATRGNDRRLLLEVPPDMIRPDPGPVAAGTEAADGRVAGLEAAVEEWRTAAEEARAASGRGRGRGPAATGRAGARAVPARPARGGAGGGPSPLVAAAGAALTRGRPGK